VADSFIAFIMLHSLINHDVLVQTPPPNPDPSIICTNISILPFSVSDLSPFFIPPLSGTGI
jgi:hypothetical protein